MKTLLRNRAAVLAASALLIALAGSAASAGFLAPLLEAVATIVFLVVLFTAPVREMPASESHFRAAVPFALGAAAAFTGTSGWLAGAPGFEHDWKWPLCALQSHDQLQSLSSLWLLWGSGGPAVEALGIYPITLANWILGYALPDNLALLALIAVIGGCAGVGIAALAAGSGLQKPYQVVLAVSIAAMPAWFNRMNAGHLQWLLGYALLPGVLALTLARIRVTKMIGGLGAMLGIAAGQAQFLLFFPLVALPFLIRRGLFLAGCAAFALMTALQLPAIIAIAYAQNVNAFASQRTNLSWQTAQSDPLSLALISGADPAHYFLHWQKTAAFLCSLLVIGLAGIGAGRNTVTRILAFVWVLSAVWSSGLDGPLAGAISWFFTHVPGALALREFAHAQAVTACALLILAAHGAHAVGRRLRGAATTGAIITFASLLPLTAAAYSGEITHLSGPVPYSAERDATARDIAGLPGSGQILWWPGLDSVGLTDEPTRGGVDSDAFATGNHAPYLEYRPTAALAQAVMALNAGDRAACGLLGDLGIQAVVMRDDVRIDAGSAFAPMRAPSERNLIRDGLREISRHGVYQVYVVPCYRGRFTIARDAAIAGDWTTVVAVARTHGSTDERTQPPPAPTGCRPQPFDAAEYRSVDIDQNWVPLTSADRYFLAFDNAFADVLITGNAANKITQVALAATSGAPYRWMTPDKLNALRLRQPVAVWEVAQCGSRLRVGTHTMSTSQPRTFRNGTFVLRGPHLVVAHYGTVAGWSLSARGEGLAQPVQADGFATGWLLRAGRWQLALVQSGPPMRLLWWAVVLAAAICAFLVLDIRFKA